MIHTAQSPCYLFHAQAFSFTEPSMFSTQNRADRAKGSTLMSFPALIQLTYTGMFNFPFFSSVLSPLTISSALSQQGASPSRTYPETGLRQRQFSSDRLHKRRIAFGWGCSGKPTACAHLPLSSRGCMNCDCPGVQFCSVRFIWVISCSSPSKLDSTGDSQLLLLAGGGDVSACTGFGGTGVSPSEAGTSSASFPASPALTLVLLARE